ncbi:MAG TPA: DNA repair protein RecN, partial [Bacillota bacterium]|nr:DNA repair protein RecN [Bacillota bacterium]
MLTELSIKDFAIIDHVSVIFNEGVTVLTGETGAGKSIIIDAVQLLAGGRGSVDFVRHGTKRAEIQGLFSIENKDHAVYEVAKSFGISIDDQMLVLQRTITSSGKSICRINGKLVTLAILREFGKTLIDIHSQHETQTLMQPESHIDLLDMYAEMNIEKTKSSYVHLYEKYKKLQDRYAQLNDNEQQLSHRQDLLEFQMNELEQAQLKPNEDEALEAERYQLAHFEKVYTSIETAYNSLYGERKGIDLVNDAKLALEDSVNYDSFIQTKHEELSNAYFIMEELAFELRSFSDTLHYDEARLNEIETRLHEIDRLKRKYGETVNDMLLYMGTIAEELEQIQNKDSHLQQLEKEIESVGKDALLEAKELHDLRKEASQALIKDIHQELQTLYLEQTEFSIHFDSIPNIDNIESISSEEVQLGPNGLDRINFLISTNVGEPLKELHKVASGGELSRIMLAIKKIFSKHQGITSVIFDEVDTGVSGRVAQAMAEKIHQISLHSQVLCITHLPQVAAMADTHLLISKKEEQSRTATYVQELTEEEQVNEISRMMTGTTITDTA